MIDQLIIPYFLKQWRIILNYYKRLWPNLIFSSLHILLISFQIKLSTRLLLLFFFGSSDKASNRNVCEVLREPIWAISFFFIKTFPSISFILLTVLQSSFHRLILEWFSLIIIDIKFLAVTFITITWNLLLLYEFERIKHFVKWLIHELSSLQAS